MGAVSFGLRVTLAAVILVTVAAVSNRYPRAGALLLSLPLVSILAFIFAWHEHRDLPAISRIARDTLILVPLGLPLFVPLAFADRLGLGFWSGLLIGVLVSAVTIGLGLWIVPSA